MNARALPWEGLLGTIPASSGSWEEQANPGDQGVEQRFVLLNGTSSGPKNSTTVSISNTNVNWLQSTRITGINDINAVSVFAGANGGVIYQCAQLPNSATETVRTFHSTTGSTFITQPSQVASVYGWLEPEIPDHNRVRPKRRFTLTLDLNFRGRPRALPIDADLE
jgi:hypothetical protein